MSNSFLYVISDDAGASIKIGRSANVYARLTTLQTGNPRPLRIIGAWEFDYADILEAERLLLNEFKQWALTGEWLNLPSEFALEYLPDFFLAEGYEARQAI